MTNISSRIRTALGGTAAAVILSACAAVGPNYAPPAAPTAAAFAMAGDRVDPSLTPAAVGDRVAGQWWSLFHSPVVDQLVREAIANNPTLAQARARLEQSRAEVGTRTGQLTADLSSSIQRERANLNAFSGGAFDLKNLPAGLSFPTNPEFNLYSIGPSVSYNLDLFGAQRRAVESLQAKAEAQARELDAAYLTLTGEVVEQALIIGDATEQTRALNEILASDQTDLDMVRKAEAAGGAAAADVAQAEAALAQDRAQIPGQAQRLAEARHRLAALIGKTPDQWSAPDIDASSGVLPTSLPVSLPSDLVRGRPDILAAEARLHAATADIGVATAALYPNITLSANTAINALTLQTLFEPSSISWSVAGGLTAPLFHSGQLKAQKREAEAAARVSLLAYEETVLEAFNQVADALTAVGHANQAYADQTAALNAAGRRLAMARQGLVEGGLSAEQVVRAERDWRRTRLLLSQQLAGRYGAAANLLLATATVPPGLAEARGSAPATAQHSGQ